MFLNGKVDWSRVIFDITRAGVSIRQIEIKLRVRRTTILAWRDHGVEPHGWITGTNILRLWARQTGNDPLKPPFV
jgi:hypothetical protein